MNDTAIQKNISVFSIEELEKIIEKYPWFSLARKELFLKLSAIGEEQRMEAIKKASVYVFSREGLLKESEMIRREYERKRAKEESAQETRVSAFELDPEHEDEEKAVIRSEPKIHIIGGDYFTLEDFKELEKDGKSTIERFKLSPSDTVKTSDEVESIEFMSQEYYTETLANIYINQGFYNKAIEVYQQLILLYPEKNTYFAALIENLKKIS